MSPIERRRPLEPDFERLRSVKLVGLGGTGSIVARYLAIFLAASSQPAKLFLIDGDDFEMRNAERMLFSRCGNKAAVVREDLIGTARSSELMMVAVEEFVSPDNLPRLLCEGDVVLLAVDNHATRKLVSEHCSRLENLCLMSVGNDGVGKDGSGELLRGTYGNLQIQIRKNGEDASPPLAAYHPEIASPRDALPTELSCSDALMSVPQILFANLASASAMLNAVFLHACGALHYPELCFDIAEGRMQPLPLPWPPG